MTPTRLKEIKERCDAATPGIDEETWRSIVEEVGWPLDDHDASFYYHARTDVPELVGYVEQLELCLLDCLTALCQWDVRDETGFARMLRRNSIARGWEALGEKDE